MPETHSPVPRNAWDPVVHEFSASARPCGCGDQTGHGAGWILTITRRSDGSQVDSWSTHRLETFAELAQTWSYAQRWDTDGGHATLLGIRGFRLAGPWQRDPAGVWRADVDAAPDGS